jgi:hypothetical protein
MSNTNSTLQIIGRVGAPVQYEATGKQFHFWIREGVLAEETQIVTCYSNIAGQPYTFYAVIDDVRRQSRKKSMAAEIDEADGDITYVSPLDSDGFTYASASILRTEPPVMTPPLERSEVCLADERAASLAYGGDEIDHPLAIGLIKNGGNHYAGPGLIDLDYLLGVNGGHLNVNGAAGRGTKSSFLLHVNWLLLREARRQQKEAPSDPDRLRVVPIILNVKNFDLFHIDRWSKRYKPEEHVVDWRALGIEDPRPFANVTFYAAQQPAGNVSVPTGRTECVLPYSWSLRDIIRNGLLQYLFAEADTNDANFGALVLDLENWLTNEVTSNDGGTITSELHADRPTTFNGLLDWVDDQANSEEDHRILRNHHPGTWKKLHRRLLKMVYESGGVLRRVDEQGHPLDLGYTDTRDPVVIDLAALAGQPELQRFVVATIFRQLVSARTGANAQRGLRYLITLDELNRFAPRGASDPITQLVETVAAEMRSQGIILLGAQQQASKVSEKVIENSAIRVMGKTGSLELGAPVWRFLSGSAKSKAESLPLNEKLVHQDNFREPMHIRVPFPVWAMNPREALPASYSPVIGEAILDGPNSTAETPEELDCL